MTAKTKKPPAPRSPMVSIPCSDGSTLRVSQRMARFAHAYAVLAQTRSEAADYAGLTEHSANKVWRDKRCVKLIHEMSRRVREHGVHRARAVLMALMDDVDITDKVRASVAMNWLDREEGKPVQRIKQDTVTRSLVIFEARRSYPEPEKRTGPLRVIAGQPAPLFAPSIPKEGRKAEGQATETPRVS